MKFKEMKHRLVVVTIGMALAATGGTTLLSASNVSAASGTSGAAFAASNLGLPAPLTGPATLAQLKARVAKYVATPRKFVGLVPVSKKATKGKTVADLVCGVPVCSSFADGMQQAAKAIGWKFVRIPLGTNPQQFADAYNQAIRLRPSLVIGSGLDRSYFNSQLLKLKALKIPVIEWSAPAVVGNGISAVMYDPPLYQESGVMLSEFIAADSNLAAKVVAVSSTQYGETTAQNDLMASYLPKICPKCTIDTLNIDPSTIGTTVPSEVVAYITAHPGTNYVMCQAAFCEGVAAALGSAGMSSVKILSRDSDTTDLQNVKNGLEYAALPLPTIQTGWQIIDCAQRIFLGKSCAADRFSPMQIVTKRTVGNNPGASTVGAVPNFKKIFLKMWGY
jgi:ribose transport system substrate-binding protein